MSTRLLNIISNDYDVDPYFNNVVLLTNFDNNIVDYSIIGNTINNINSVAFSNTYYKYGTHSMYFDPTLTQYLSINQNSNFNFGNSDFTIEAWIYLKSYPATGNRGILGKWTNNTDGEFRLGIHSSSYIDFRISNGTTAYYIITENNQTVPLNQWVFISACRYGDMLYTGVNGVVGGKNIGGTYTLPITTNPIEIGRNGYGSTYYFDGYIDEVRVTNGIAKYISNFTPPVNQYPIKDLYFDYVKTLLHCNSLPVSDSSRTFLYYTNNRATLDTSIKRFGSASYYFDTVNTSSITTTDPVNLGTGDFTIECFFYPTQSQVTNAAIICSNATGAAGNWQISCTSSNKLQYYKSASALITSINSYNLNSWNHMAIVRQSGTSYMYLNGVLEISTSNTDNYNLNQGLRIGLNRDGTAYFVGNIDEIRITIGIARYTANFNVPVNEFPNQ